MLKTLTILLSITVLPSYVLGQDLTNTCAPNQMTIFDAIKSMRDNGLKVMAYDGDNAKLVKDYMENVIGMEMLDSTPLSLAVKAKRQIRLR